MREKRRGAPGRPRRGKKAGINKMQQGATRRKCCPAWLREREEGGHPATLFRPLSTIFDQYVHFFFDSYRHFSDRHPWRPRRQDMGHHRGRRAAFARQAEKMTASRAAPARPCQIRRGTAPDTQTHVRTCTGHAHAKKKKLPGKTK